MWWSTNDSGVLREHGAIDGLIEAPVRTDVFGAAPLRYLPKEEEANGQGDEVADVANLEARVGVRELVTHFYDVPQFALLFMSGDRVAPALLGSAGMRKPRPSSRSSGRTPTTASPTPSRSSAT